MQNNRRFDGDINALSSARLQSEFQFLYLHCILSIKYEIQSYAQTCLLTL